MKQKEWHSTILSIIKLNIVRQSETYNNLSINDMNIKRN